MPEKKKKAEVLTATRHRSEPESDMEVLAASGVIAV